MKEERGPRRSGNRNTHINVPKSGMSTKPSKVKLLLISQEVPTPTKSKFGHPKCCSKKRETKFANRTDGDDQPTSRQRRSMYNDNVSDDGTDMLSCIQPFPGTQRRSAGVRLSLLISKLKMLMNGQAVAYSHFCGQQASLSYFL